MIAFLKWWFFWCGGAANLVLLVCILYFIFKTFIYPFVEACSLTRCYIKALGNEQKCNRIRLVCFYYKNIVCTRGRVTFSSERFSWYGVGNWIIHNSPKGKE